MALRKQLQRHDCQMEACGLVGPALVSASGRFLTTRSGVFLSALWISCADGEG